MVYEMIYMKIKIKINVFLFLDAVFVAYSVPRYVMHHPFGMFLSNR